MVKIKIIAFFLCLLMTLQILPIAQIGSIISSNQWTEELPHNNCEESTKGDFVKLMSTYMPPEQYAMSTLFFHSHIIIYIHTSAQIPSNHSTDVVTPPPDTVV